jgi:hypothetical protein
MRRRRLGAVPISPIPVPSNYNPEELNRRHQLNPRGPLSPREEIRRRPEAVPRSPVSSNTNNGNPSVENILPQPPIDLPIPIEFELEDARRREDLRRRRGVYNRQRRLRRLSLMSTSPLPPTNNPVELNRGPTLPPLNNPVELRRWEELNDREEIRRMLEAVPRSPVSSNTNNGNPSVENILPQPPRDLPLSTNHEPVEVNRREELNRRPTLPPINNPVDLRHSSLFPPMNNPGGLNRGPTLPPLNNPEELRRWEELNDREEIRRRPQFPPNSTEE